MVAKIISGKRIKGILHYNENKVAQGQAQLIMASGFAGEIDQMNFDSKIKRFEKLTMLSDKVKTNALHISLNFDASEKLNNAKMQAIAANYMDKIGFGDQPFLVYRHTDAAHSHVHIVTTTMQASGERIDIHRIGMLKSEPARKQIEQEFNLVRAQSKTFKQQAAIKPADITKAQYGHIPTKRAISNVVGAVMSQYKFTSLAEFNAVLRQFNVQADRGGEGTMMYQKEGLIYSLLDKNGSSIGIPIKASAFYSKPTLFNLEKKFAQNTVRRAAYRDDLKGEIERVFKKYHQLTKTTFIAELQKENIQTLFRQNEQGLTYGVTFIDNTNMAVFKGSDLGKGYGSKALTERFGRVDQPVKPTTKTWLKTGQPKQTYLKRDAQTTYLKTIEPATQQFDSGVDKLLQNLMEKTTGDSAPITPRRKKRKKQEQGQHL
ncbi:relaxase/mobilization nuclease domain-containing protein [Mucilaginibacter sp. L3T2-6]|uniref:relaxase/mobilization nuclease domain-containing protein n=1 Tax=Mucilaginibacter sp. L3T2-6 TaxID=3062491 RepID=UPI0026762327|nr:relaxase/mobilization nuclease domain-containing protein [Mucilaginibacter sp. L3T2-6]MDO3644545.1 relaxase/mobilization nuclease domain-containing protein [Mucilaginibacter sp. L3T2-6]MDV6217083.1 relaxase/mobilization nuclease domain-containing protein [Mucilaginibacter sp. L3T2-6]